MKGFLKIVVLFVLAMSMLASVLVSCGGSQKPETAEACAKEYVESLLKGDLEHAFELNASFNYDDFVRIVLASFSFLEKEAPEEAEFTKKRYKTNDVRKIAKEIIKETEENIQTEAELNGFNASSVVAMETDRFFEKEMYYAIVDFNEEIVREMYELGDYGCDLSLFTLNPDEIESVVEVRVVTQNTNYYLLVVKVNGVWKVADIELIAEMLQI